MSFDFTADLDRQREDYEFGGTRRAPDSTAGFIESALSAATRELIGLDAALEVTQYRAENPVTGFASQVAGSLAGFGALTAVTGGLGPGALVGRLGAPAAVQWGARALTRVPGIGTGIGRALAGEIGEAAFTRGAAHTVASTLPAELTRLALSVPFGDPKQTAIDLSIELPFAAGVGGALRGLTEARPGRAKLRGVRGLEKLREVQRDFVEAPSSQVTYQRVTNLRDQAIASGKLEASPDLKSALDESIFGGPSLQTSFTTRPPGSRSDPKRLNLPAVVGLRDAIALEDIPKGIQPVRELVGAPKLNRQFGQLFINARGKFGTTFKIHRNEFEGSDLDFDEIFTKSGPGFDKPDYQKHMQYGRYLVAEEDIQSKAIREKFSEGRPVGHKTWLLEEVDGAYVMMRIVKGLVGSPNKKTGFASAKGRFKKDDVFAIWKTDHPGFFGADEVEYAQRIGEEIFNPPGVQAVLPLQRDTAIGREYEAKRRALDPNVSFRGTDKNMLQKHLEKLNNTETHTVVTDLAALGGMTATAVKNLAAPALHQFKDTPKAMTLLALARSGYGSAHKIATEVFGGIPDFSKVKAKSLLRRTLISTPEPQANSLKAKFDALGEEQLKDFKRHIAAGTPVEELTGADKAVREAIEELYRVESLLDADRIKINKVVGIGNSDLSIFRQVHPVLMNGGFRVPVVYENPELGKRIVWLASGNRRAEAIKQADAIAKSINETPGLNKVKVDLEEIMTRQGDFFSNNDLIDKLVGGGRLDISSPEAQLAKQRFAEMAGDLPITKAEMQDELFDNILATQRSNFEKLFTHHERGRIVDLFRTRPFVYAQMEKRLNRMAGRIDTDPIIRTLDDALGPVFGANFGGRAVAALNEAQFALTLGAGDIGFPVMNALSFAQTVLPEVSLVTTATSERIATLYSPALIPAGKGMRPVNVLDPLKWVKLGFKEMKLAHGADEALTADLNRATAEGKIGPRFVEEWRGAIEEKISGVGFKEVFSGKQSPVQFLKNLSAYLPAKSESFARMHAFVTGRRLALDFLELPPDKAYEFASQFVDRTMFLYTQADRSQMFASPIGGVFGLFKTWMLNYLGLMADQVSHIGDNPWSAKHWQSLMWMFTGTGALAGAGGVPLVGVADAFSRMVSDKSLVSNLYEGMGYEDLPGVAQKGIDSIYYGLPAFLGVTLQSRAASPLNDPVRDIQMLWSAALFQRYQLMRDSFGEAANTMLKAGKHPGRNPAFRRQFWAAFSPRTMTRAMQIQSDGAIASIRSGNRLIEGNNIAELTSHVFGIAPLDIVKSFDKNAESFANRDSTRTTVHTLGNIAAGALEDEDWEGYSRVMMEAFYRNVDPGSVSRRAMALNRNAQRPVGERLFGTFADREAARRLGIID